MTDKVSRIPQKSSTSGSAWVSFEGLRWASQQMPRADLTPSVKLVLFAMAASLRGDDCQVWPSRRRLAAMTGLSVASVDRAVGDLAAADLIRVERRQADHGDSDTNVYTLALGGDNLQPPPLTMVPGGGRKLRPNVQVQDQYTRTSTRQAEQQALISDPAALTFPVDGPGGPEWPLGQSLVAELTELFPTLDVLGECRAALAWVRANPAGRKTSSGMRRFLTGWLTRSTDRARQTTAHHGHRAPTGAQALQRRIEDSGTVDLGGLVDWYENDGSRK